MLHLVCMSPIHLDCICASISCLCGWDIMYHNHNLKEETPSLRSFGPWLVIPKQEYHSRRQGVTKLPVSIINRKQHRNSFKQNELWTRQEAHGYPSVTQLDTLRDVFHQFPKRNPNKTILIFHSNHPSHTLATNISP